MPNDLSYVGCVLVAMKLKKGLVFPEGVGGLYYPGNRYHFKRVCEYPSMTEESYPKIKNGTLIGFEYSVFPWDEKPFSEEFYIEDSLRACRELINQEPEVYRLHHQKDIYPIRDDQQMKIYSKIEQEVSTFKNFFLNGRFGNFRYVNMNDCFEMSFDLIKELSGLSKQTLLKKINL